MRYADCYRLAKQMLPYLPGFVTNKANELFIEPIGDVFRGFLFESTAGSREDFYFWWFFMPMAPATDHFRLTYGERLSAPGGNSGWRSDMRNLPDQLLTAMKPKALPLLRSINSNRAAVDAIVNRYHPAPVTSIHPQSDVACLLVLDGQFDEARDWMDKVVEWERSADQRQWVVDLVARTKELRSLLVQDQQLALERVQQWRNHSINALKLTRWR